MPQKLLRHSLLAEVSRSDGGGQSMIVDGEWWIGKSS